MWLQLIERLGKTIVNPAVTSDRYNRLLFEDFGEATGFDAAYLLEENGAILEVIAEPAARKAHSNTWDEAAFVEAIDHWVCMTYVDRELEALQLQLFSNEFDSRSSTIHPILH